MHFPGLFLVGHVILSRKGWILFKLTSQDSCESWLQPWQRGQDQGHFQKMAWKNQTRIWLKKAPYQYASLGTSHFLFLTELDFSLLPCLVNIKVELF